MACEKTKDNELVAAQEQAKALAMQRETSLRMAHYFECAPGLFFIMRLESSGRIAMPFLAGRIASLPGLTPEAVSEDIEPLLALCHPDDTAPLLAELQRSGCEMTPCCIEFRIGTPLVGQSVMELKALPRRDENCPGTVEWHGFMHDITGSKRKEKALLDSEREYRTLADNLPSPVIRYEADGRLRYLNPAAERAMGVNAADLLGQRVGISGLLSPEMLRLYRATIDEVVTTRTVRDLEIVPLALPGGRPEHYSVRMVPDPAPDGSIGVLALGFEITDRKHAENALHDREAFLASLLDTIPIPVLYKDREGRYLGLNKAFETFHGISREKLIGKSVFDLFPRELAEIHHAKDEALFEQGGIQQYESRAINAQGLTREVVIHKAVFADKKGNAAGLIGAMQEITERKRMEEELRRREQYQRTLLDNFPFFVWLKDEESRLLAANIEYARVARVESSTDLEGKTDFDFFPRDLAEKYVADDRAVMAARLPKSAEEMYADERGERRWMETWKSPLIVDGRVVGTVGFSRDMTERKQAEQKLKEALEFTEGIINAIPDILFEVNRDGRYLNVWTRSPELLAQQKEALLGKTVHEVLSPETAAAAMKAIAEADEKGVAYGHVFRVDLPHGPAWFEHSISKKSGDSASDVRYLVLSRNVTERKRMEAALALREREFRTLIENSPDTVARYGRDLRRLYVNPAFAALVEGGTTALIGKTPSECSGGPNAAIYEQNLGKVFASGNECEFELQEKDRNGKELCSLIRLTPEFGQDGTVESILAVGRDITELNAFRQKIHQMAFYDPLTSLPNRALFKDRLRQMIVDASWHGQTAGVMMVDMDRFKEVNDTMGHAVGDELLREAAARLSACVRAYDTVARLGGDEFAILLPEIRNSDDLGRIASKLLGTFDERFLLDGKEVFVSCSIGIALYPNDSTEANDLVKYADSAMYFAKRSGRNNFRFYSKDLTASAQDRLMLESELRHAVERKELELYYQPKVLLRNGMMIGSEALLRWHHPRLGMVPPNQFIQIAEDTGLIIDLGKWVLREACCTASEWNTEGKPLHKVAINLSARQFQSQNLAMTVADILDETACRPEWIELEITESLLLDEDGKTLDMLSALRSMGISIAIDDFGTGYSALSYLTRFPIDTLKIDRSFIHSVTTDNYRAELVKAILSIARSLGQEVVAEGVETVEQAAFLEVNDCQVAQGFLYSKPLPKIEIASLPRHFACGNPTVKEAGSQSS